jgi:hypothetical protein
MSTAEKLKERKLDRMRLGQAACDIVPLVSDPEIRVALVPLTEAEYLRSLELAAALATYENRIGLEFRERHQTAQIVWMATREPDNLKNKVWESAEAMMGDIEFHDINHLFDHYLEMVDQSSPAIDGVPPEDFEALKKVLQEISWNDLTGRQWYAAKRFLGSISNLLPPDRSHGFSLTKSLMSMNENLDSASNASESGASQPARDVVSD